ncbi:hypothetical protein SVAN01_03919 [Stagonosporopsis vannaccii]|nr:hypothetical protein SVAN01_03919 [Stagonosporopsis vannaccii]
MGAAGGAWAWVRTGNARWRSAETVVGAAWGALLDKRSRATKAVSLDAAGSRRGAQAKRSGISYQRTKANHRPDAGRKVSATRFCSDRPWTRARIVAAWSHLVFVDRRSRSSLPSDFSTPMGAYAVLAAGLSMAAFQGLHVKLLRPLETTGTARAEIRARGQSSRAVMQCR